MTESTLCVIECLELKADRIIICAITQLNYDCLGLTPHTVHLSDILELNLSFLSLCFGIKPEDAAKMWI